MLVFGENMAPIARKLFVTKYKSKLETLDKKESLIRLETAQKILFKNQIEMNKSLENQIINVLVEKQTDEKIKLFGRSEYMTSVIFNGCDNLIGKIVKVKILKSNLSI